MIVKNRQSVKGRLQGFYQCEEFDNNRNEGWKMAGDSLRNNFVKNEMGANSLVEVLSDKWGLGMGGNGQSSRQGYVEVTLHLQRWKCLETGNRRNISLSKRKAGEKREEKRKESWGFQRKLTQVGWDDLSDKITCYKVPKGTSFTQGSSALGVGEFSSPCSSATSALPG